MKIGNPARTIRTGTRFFKADLQAAAAAAMIVRGDASLAYALLEPGLRLTRPLADALRAALCGKLPATRRGAKPKRDVEMLRNDEWAPIKRAALRKAVKDSANGGNREQRLKTIADRLDVAGHELRAFLYPRRK